MHSRRQGRPDRSAATRRDDKRAAVVGDGVNDARDLTTNGQQPHVGELRELRVLSVPGVEIRGAIFGKSGSVPNFGSDLARIQRNLPLVGEGSRSSALRSRWSATRSTSRSSIGLHSASRSREMIHTHRTWRLAFRRRSAVRSGGPVTSRLLTPPSPPDQSGPRRYERVGFGLTTSVGQPSVSHPARPEWRALG